MRNMRVSGLWARGMAGASRPAGIIGMRAIGKRVRRMDSGLNFMAVCPPVTVLTMQSKRPSSPTSILRCPAKYISVSGRKVKEMELESLGV
jgi:hypothetical protein